MAKPRIFISSTYYDLKQTREDVANFLTSLGYEPIRNENGNIPYGPNDKLEDYCYKEIHNVDILVSIIGGRYGSEAQSSQWSISNQELLTALRDNKQVYIFIDKNVDSEYMTYLKNKDNTDIKYCFVDNIQIYKFIEQVRGFRKNNNIKAFETSADILFYLKEQLAGLFQTYLDNHSKMNDFNLAQKLENATKNLEDLVKVLVDSNKSNKKTVESLLKSNHPAVKRIADLFNIKFGFWFDSYEMLDNLLCTLGWESPMNNTESAEVIEWTKGGDLFIDSITTLYVKKDIFNEDKTLKSISLAEWDDSFIRMEKKSTTFPDFTSNTEDLPF